jgi:ATP-dependent DNA ligase
MPIMYPPRPRGAVPASELPYYENLGVFCAQNKLQGARTVIHILKNGSVEMFSRHGKPFANYKMPKFMQNEILALPGLKIGVEYWLDGELMIKTKAEDTKGKLILFDILQYDKYLFLKPNLEGRLKLLNEICGYPTNLDSLRGMAYKISENVMMIKTIYSNFKEAFNKDYGDEVEGLVLKKKDSVLDNFGQKEYLVDWLIRCRKPHKNYQF